MKVNVTCLLSVVLIYSSPTLGIAGSKNYSQCDSKYNGYTGEMKNGHPNGMGLLQLSNCDYYAGEFKNGLPNGCGMMVKFNHGKYNEIAMSGDFVDGVPRGEVVVYTDKHDYFLLGTTNDDGELDDYSEITSRLTLMSNANKADRIMEYTHGDYVRHFISGEPSRTGIDQAAASATLVMDAAKEAIKTVVADAKDCFTSPGCFDSVVLDTSHESVSNKSYSCIVYCTNSIIIAAAGFGEKDKIHSIPVEVSATSQNKAEEYTKRKATDYCKQYKMMSLGGGKASCR